MQHNPELLSSHQSPSIIMPSDYRYFLVHPQPSTKISKNQEKSINQPHVLIFDNEQLTINQLIIQYCQELKIDREIKGIQFFSSPLNRLKKQWTVEMVRNSYRVDCIDGLQIYCKFTELSIINECAVIETFEQEKSIFNDKGFELSVEVLLIDGNYKREKIYVFYEYLEPLENFQKKVCKQILRKYGKKLDPKLIQLHLRQKDKVVLLTTKILQKIDSNKQIFLSTNIKFKKPKYQSSSKLILQSGYTYKQACFEDLKDLKVKDVLIGFLKIHKNTAKYCGLKVMDYYLKPNDFIFIIEKLFSQKKAAIKVVANIIKEKTIFYREIEKVQRSFEIEELKIYKNESNQQRLSKFYRKIQENSIRIKKKPKDKHQIEQSKSITLYTSELECKFGLRASYEPFFKIINTFMRQNNFSEEKNYDKFQCRFSADLINDLKKLKNPQKKVVFRGINFSFPHLKKNQIIQFKEFVSSSASQSIALRFAKKSLLKIKYQNVKNVQQYSVYPDQEETIFLPFTKFKVTNISQQPNNHYNIMMQVYEMEEISPQPVSDSTAVFIIWVDDKTIEGKRIWQQLCQIKRTTVMYQLLSNQQLQSWLIDHKKTLQNPLAEIILITNMKRSQKTLIESEAGIKSINLFRNHCSKSSIFIFIGNLEKTRQKLQQHKIQENQRLIVSNLKGDLKNFLKKKLG